MHVQTNVSKRKPNKKGHFLEPFFSESSPIFSHILPNFKILIGDPALPYNNKVGIRSRYVHCKK